MYDHLRALVVHVPEPVREVLLAAVPEFVGAVAAALFVRGTVRAWRRVFGQERE
ncbi:hypothetical protein [Streptomyces sp. NPDC029003]|uniref:hypothetical protein n=1 Tax=Streptomyces sp. NPDC029003 TaxID=3155125 RepID=UPI0033E30856